MIQGPGGPVRRGEGQIGPHTVTGQGFANQTSRQKAGQVRRQLRLQGGREPACLTRGLQRLRPVAHGTGGNVKLDQSGFQRRQGEAEIIRRLAGNDAGSAAFQSGAGPGAGLDHEMADAPIKTGRTVNIRRNQSRQGAHGELALLLPPEKRLGTRLGHRPAELRGLVAGDQAGIGKDEFRRHQPVGLPLPQRLRNRAGKLAFAFARRTGPQAGIQPVRTGRTGQHVQGQLVARDQIGADPRPGPEKVDIGLSPPTGHQGPFHLLRPETPRRHTVGHGPGQGGLDPRLSVRLRGGQPVDTAGTVEPGQEVVAGDQERADQPGRLHTLIEGPPEAPDQQSADPGFPGGLRLGPPGIHPVAAFRFTQPAGLTGRFRVRTVGPVCPACL